jgi:hypothetical protein
MISDTKTRRWTGVALRSKEAALEECAALNFEWDKQRLHELMRIK